MRVSDVLAYTSWLPPVLKPTDSIQLIYLLVSVLGTPFLLKTNFFFNELVIFSTFGNSVCCIRLVTEFVVIPG